MMTLNPIDFKTALTLPSISPNGGRTKIGVTPMTSRITFAVQIISATI